MATAPQPLPPGLRLERVGAYSSGTKVYRGQRLLGWVDRYDYRTGRLNANWRYSVEPGGETCPPRYRTRHLAILALLERSTA
jgi:hypothetical protein